MSRAAMTRMVADCRPRGSREGGHWPPLPPPKEVATTMRHSHPHNSLMPEHVAFHGVDDAAKQDIRAYWERKWKRLERLLQPFPPDQRHLRLAIHSNAPFYDVRAVLLLPTGTLVANGRSHRPDFHEAIDLVADRLAEEIRRHKGLLRHDHLYHRKRRRQRDLIGIRAAVEEHFAKRDRQAFAEVLRPALRGLQDHAQRELVIAQLEGRVRPNDLTVSDLIDEVVAKAYEQFAERPPGSLDRWFVRLLHELIDARAIESPPGESLEQVIPADDHRFRADSGWVLENEPFWTDVEPLSLEQVLPAQDVPEPWQQLAAEEQRQEILKLLHTMPRHQRRTFTLHALDGWDADEIAMIQGRSVEDVRRDIDDARDFLREKLAKPRERMGRRA